MLGNININNYEDIYINKNTISPRKCYEVFNNPMLNKWPITKNACNAVGSASETSIRSCSLCTCNDYLKNPKSMYSLPTIRRMFCSENFTVGLDNERRLYSDEKSIVINNQYGKFQPRFVLCKY